MASPDVQPVVATRRPPGPYMLQPLVDNLPLDAETQGVSITCIEAWAQNLYVGTSAHEVLHFVSVPTTPNPNSAEPPKPLYILASRNSPPAAAIPNPRIKQILLLPSVSKAVVLSSTGTVSSYQLPEFSPAFNGTTLKGNTFVGGLDLTEEEEQRLSGSDEGGDPRGKLIMVLTKKRIRMIRVGEELRLVKGIELPDSVIAARRGVIACIASDKEYSLIDVDNSGRIPLFPISTSNDRPAVEEPSAASPGVSPVRSPTPTGQASRPHPPRTSSLNPNRERRHSSATSSREHSANGHNRSTSASNISGHPTNRGGSTRGSSTRGGRLPRPSSGLLSPPEVGTPRSPSPTSPPLPETSRGSSASPSPPSTSPTKSRMTRSPAPERGSATPIPSRGSLKPHIVSPTPSEFLLTTGTRPEEPGVGLFVDMNGDVTRGTISFEKYPDQILVDDRWVIAVIPGFGLEVQRWDTDDNESEDVEENKGWIGMDGDLQIKKVFGLDGTVVPEVGRLLQLVRVRLNTAEGGEADDLPQDARRNEEERAIALRISTIDSRVVVFNGKQVWSFLRSPLVLRLNSKLPNFTDSKNDGIESRINRILRVLRIAGAIEPDTERGFNEVSFLRQKCGLMILGELLQMLPTQKGLIKPQEIMLAEEALGLVDPRMVVSLFGKGFVDDAPEGDKGLWMYGGIREVYRNLQVPPTSTKHFMRDALLLLKRYLVGWRSRKGLGSVAEEKEVFYTVDAALLRVLLMLDSPEYLVEKGSTVVQEGDVRKELYAFLGPNLEDFNRAVQLLEDFGRLYALSLLYSMNKMYRNVLLTWQRILEGGETSGELEDGEERFKSYLMQMKDPRLVEEFGRWLAARNPALGIQVFADERSRVKFEPSKVLEILREHAPAAVKSYVEYLVVEKKNNDYANDLILLYLDDLIVTLSSTSSATERLKDSYESYRALDNPKPTYREFIVDNSPPVGDDIWWHNRLRLLELLGGATGYAVPPILAKVEPFSDVLVPEMVILYGREGRHEDALAMLTHGLKDFDTAINYCLFGGLSIYQTSKVITDRTEQKELFSVLLKEFLELKDLGERIEMTGMLLERFGGWLDVMHVLSVIPDSWSIDILSGFLISALRQLVREKAEVGVARALRTSDNLRVEAEFVGKCDDIGPTVEQE